MTGQPPWGLGTADGEELEGQSSGRRTPAGGHKVWVQGPGGRAGTSGGCAGVQCALGVQCAHLVWAMSQSGMGLGGLPLPNKVKEEAAPDTLATGAKAPMGT